MACRLGHGRHAPRRDTRLVRHGVTSQTRHIRPETRQAQPRAGARVECRLLTQPPGLRKNQFARDFEKASCEGVYGPDSGLPQRMLFSPPTPVGRITRTVRAAPPRARFPARPPISLRV